MELFIPAQIEVWDRLRDVVIENLSLCGVRVATYDRFSIGERLSLRFSVTIPGYAGEECAEIEIAAPSLVAWHQPGCVGLTFEGLRAAQVWAIGKFLGTRAVTPCAA